MRKAEISRRTTRRPCGGSAWRRRRRTRSRSGLRRSTSASCITKARVSRRTTRRRCGGTVWRPTRETRMHSSDLENAVAQRPAQVHLGLMYYQGQGVPQDYKEAMRWYRLAADQGDADAQFNLDRKSGV